MSNEKIFTKGVLIFLAIFACIALGITAALVVLKKSTTTPEKPSNPSKLEIDYRLGVTDSTEKYPLNNLETTEIMHNEGGRVYLSQYANPYKLSVSYYTIDGLKNKEVENKINERIKEEAFKLVPTEEADTKSVSCYVSGNFSNILSLNFSSSYNTKKGDNDYDYHSGKSSAITFDLNTGDTIALKDCFVDNVNINVILNNAAYKSLAWDEKYMWGTWNEETDEYEEPVDRRDLEDRVFAFMHTVSKGNYTFYVNDYGINVQTDGAWASIDFDDCYDKIAIFKRYLTKDSIFTDKYNLASEVYYGIPYMSKNIDEPAQNLITVNELYYEDWEDEQIIDELVKSRLEADKKYASKNPDTEILEILTNGYYSWDFYDKIWEEYYRQNNYSLYGRGIAILRVEIPKNYYDSNDIRARFFEVLRSGFNSMAGEVLYASIDFFQTLKEENSSIMFVSSTKGNIYGFDRDEETWERYNTRLIAQDYDMLESSSKLLSAEDLAGLDTDELNKAYNEIFARHGHDFDSKDLKEYFWGFLWYAPEPGKKVTLEELSDIERKNIETIRARINELKQ